MLLLIVVIFSYILVFHVFLCTKESFVTIGDFPERVKQQPILEKYVDLYAGKREQIVGKGSFACGSSFVDLLCPGGSNLSGIVLHASKVDSTSVGGVDLVCGDGTNNMERLNITGTMASTTLATNNILQVKDQAQCVLEAVANSPDMLTCNIVYRRN